MLVAIAITLLIMSAIVTVFANVSGSVTRRRATIELASQLRNVRETLARDLAGATCPAVPTQRPESNVGYLEIIEGPQNDYYPTPWIFDADGNGVGDLIGNVEGIDLGLSTLPSSNLDGNLAPEVEGRGLFVGNNLPLPEEVKTDGRGLGDADDILMLTVRNETEPFVGRIPLRAGANTPATGSFDTWFQEFEPVESTLAEVVWFAVENPVDPDRTFAFGEPGYRNIYRRALLILPDLDYRIDVIANGIGIETADPTTVAGQLSAPGVVRVLPPDVGRDASVSALAALIAFQERYDLSVRLEWDPLLPDGTNNGVGDPVDPPGRWVLKANSLSDLTRRENRYEHHGFVNPEPGPNKWQRVPATRPDRFYPYAAASGGVYGVTGETRLDLAIVPDPELVAAVTDANGFQAFLAAGTNFISNTEFVPGTRGDYPARPFVATLDPEDTPATTRAILNESGAIVHVTTGLAPLGGVRRGDDLMMTEALAFDLRVFDPGAPNYSYFLPGAPNDPPDQVVSPGDPSWATAFFSDTDGSDFGDGTVSFRLQGQGAYVDLAYGRSYINPGVSTSSIPERFGRATLDDQWRDAEANGFVRARFFTDGLFRVPVLLSPALRTPPLTQRYAVFDTGSLHYESNGVDDDGDLPGGGIRQAITDPASTDEGANSLDNVALYIDVNPLNGSTTPVLATRFGPDDPAERETPPPYDTALRGLQVTLRAYERDSRQIREVNVRESFVPE